MSIKIQIPTPMREQAGGKSEVDTWLDSIAGFMIDVGTIPKAPDVKTYVDDSAMRMVSSGR